MVEVLTVLTTLVLGVFAGSMLTEALLLVPYFRSLSFADFNRLHTEFGPRLYKFYAPLTISASVVPIVTALATLLDAQSNWYAWLAAGLVVVVLSTYTLYFRAANQAFTDKRLDETALAQELTRWASVHNFRTAVTLCAFVASVLAVLRATGRL